LPTSKRGNSIIPAAFLDGDPAESGTPCLRFFEAHGVEDPQRYVVGSEMQTASTPSQGLPEFFKFIKNDISKAFQRPSQTSSKAL
jgi:hypothetical protein